MQKLKKSKFSIILKKDWCKGCNICVSVCPVKAFQIGSNLNSSGYYYPNRNSSLCIGCGLCENLCPDLVITIKDKGKT